MKRLFPLLCIGIAVGLRPCHAAPGAGGAFGSKRAVIFGIDGCRADALKLAVENGTAPNIARLIATGSVTWNAYAGGVPGTSTRQTTNSGPGWASVLTGVWVDKHGVNDNTFAGSRFDAYPHFFRHLHDDHPDSVLASLVSWPEIHDFIVADSGGATICDCHTSTSGSYDQRDLDLIAQTVTLLQTGDPEVVFCYQGNVDIMGHTYGFHPTVPQYMAAIAAADARIGQVLSAIRARSQFAQENWLFLVTTDHGGKGLGHGGQSAEERVIPFIASGGEVPKGLISREIIGQVVAPATVYRHLGLGIPASWGWESDAFQIGARLQAATGARANFLSWSLPAGGIAGLSGFELLRDDVSIATFGSNERHFTDAAPNPTGAAVRYRLKLIGSTEADLSASTGARNSSVPGPPPEIHLPFDGDLLDTSGRGNHAAAEGAPVYVAGHSGQALTLDGAHSARIGTPAAGVPADLRFGADTDFTVSFWFQATAGWTADPGILSNKDWDSGANPGWIVAGENNGGNWQWNFKGATLTRRDFDPSDAPIADNNWHLVTIAHDRDGDAVFYQDGREIGRVTIAGAGDIDTALPLRIGRDGDNAYPWNQGASIDDLKIWRRMLPPTEVLMEAADWNPVALFTAWMADQADLFHRSGEDLTPAGDPDSDGCDNLLEYSAGTSPFRAEERPCLHAERVGGKMRVRFVQRDGGSGVHGIDPGYRAAGLSYRLEVSSALDGSEVPVTGAATQIDAEAVPVRAGFHQIVVDLPMNGPKSFCRLKVELMP